MDAFEPKLNILPDAQRRLWPELASLPRSFVLYGGTALALRVGHRVSVDFDMFTADPLDRQALSRDVAFLRDAAVLHEEPNALTVSVDRGDPVKVSLFGSIDFGRVGSPENTADGVGRVASLLDLGATKIKVLLQRVQAKDYVDVAALLRAGVPLDRILAAAKTLFGDTFNPLVAQKTLCWFESGELSALSADDRELLVREAGRDLDLPAMPRLSPRLD
jgi:hypothetical protein